MAGDGFRCPGREGQVGSAREELDHRAGLAGHEARLGGARVHRRRTGSSALGDRRPHRGGALGRSPGSTTCTSRAARARAAATAPSSTRCGRVSARPVSLPLAGSPSLGLNDQEARAAPPERPGAWWRTGTPAPPRPRRSIALQVRRAAARARSGAVRAGRGAPPATGPRDAGQQGRPRGAVSSVGWGPATRDGRAIAVSGCLEVDGRVSVAAARATGAAGATTARSRRARAAATAP